MGSESLAGVHWCSLVAMEGRGWSWEPRRRQWSWPKHENQDGGHAGVRSDLIMDGLGRV